MADPYEVKIRTTAEGTGAEETDRKLDEIERKTAEINAKKESAAPLKDILPVEQKITAEKTAQNVQSVAAAEATATQGANLNEAAEAASRLAQNLATGGDATRSLGSLIAALAPSLAPVAVAAFALYEALKATHSIATGLGKLFGGFSFGDLVSGFNPEAIARQITAANQLKQRLEEISKLSFNELSSALDKGREKLTALSDKYREELLKDDSLLEPIKQQHQHVLQSMREQIAALERENTLLEFERNITEATQKLEEEKTAELQRQAALRAADIQAQSEVTSLEKEINATRDAGLSNTAKVDLYRQKVADIQHALANLGVSASSPNEAYTKSIGLSDTVRAKVLEQVKAWQEVGSEQEKTNKAIDAERRKIEETNAGALTEKIRLLREAAKYNPSAGHSEQADRLEGKGPGTGKVDESFYQNILKNDPTDVNANLAMEAIIKQKIAAQDALIKVNTEASTAITATAKGGTDAIVRSVQDTSAAIPALFQPVADRIANDIPKAIDAGLSELSKAVTTGIGNIAGDFKGQVADLQQQIDAIWQNI